jgi:ABC-type uncharacterized transport system substrate-binding protein
VDGKTLTTDYRHARGQSDRVGDLAAELARSKVDILAGIGGDIAAALNDSRLAVLWDPSHVDNDFTEIRKAAQRLDIKLQSLELRRPADLDASIQAAAQGRAATLIAVPGRLTAFLSKRIVDAAMQHRIPVISGWREPPERGAVLRYGPRSRGEPKAVSLQRTEDCDE